MDAVHCEGTAVVPDLVASVSKIFSQPFRCAHPIVEENKKPARSRHRDRNLDILSPLVVIEWLYVISPDKISGHAAFGHAIPIVGRPIDVRQCIFLQSPWNNLIEAS